MTTTTADSLAVIIHGKHQNGDDTVRYVKSLYSRGNMVISHFKTCSASIRVKLFRSFYQSINSIRISVLRWPLIIYTKIIWYFKGGKICLQFMSIIILIHFTDWFAKKRYSFIILTLALDGRRYLISIFYILFMCVIYFTVSYVYMEFYILK